MQCPYCFSEAHDEASRCPHCRSEIGVFRPLLARLEALEARTESLEAALDARRGATVAAVEASPGRQAAKQQPRRQHHTSMLSWCGITVCALALLHYLLLFVLDANPLVLRVITLSLPAASAFLAARSSPMGLAPILVAGSVVGVLSVAAMLGITAVIDDVPFWPQTSRDLRETVEYTAGIALAFASGGLAVWSWRRSRHFPEARRAPSSTAWQGSLSSSTRARVAHSWTLLTRIASAVAPVASCATAFYTGLKNFLGT